MATQQRREMGETLQSLFFFSLASVMNVCGVGYMGKTYKPVIRHPI